MFFSRSILFFVYINNTMIWQIMVVFSNQYLSKYIFKQKLGNFVKHGLKGAVFVLPFLTTFMDRIATLSLVDGTSMQVHHVYFGCLLIYFLQPLLNPTGLNNDWILIKRWHIDDYCLQKDDIISFEYVFDASINHL